MLAMTKIVYKKDTKEFVVQAYDENGKRMEEADYFTNDKKDAEDTAKSMRQNLPDIIRRWAQAQLKEASNYTDIEALEQSTYNEAVMDKMRELLDVINGKPKTSSPGDNHEVGGVI